MRNGSSTHFVLSAGYEGGGGSGGGYNRGRSDHRGDDDRGSSGYSRSGDDRGSGGYNRGRSDYHDKSDDHGSAGGGGYSRGRSDHYSNNGGGGGGGYGGDDNRMETQRDTIFIQNLPRSVTADELRDVFSQIGMIKVKCHTLERTNSYFFFLLE